MTLRHRGKPQMRILAQPEAPPAEPVIPVRKRPWWRFWEREPELSQRAGQILTPPPRPALVGHDVLVIGTYQCGTCAFNLKFEQVESNLVLAQQRYAIGACENSKCRLNGVRLRVPLTVIRCELVPE